MGEFAVSIEHSEAKSVPASRGLRLPDPPPGAMPLDPAGGSAPRPPLQARAPRASHGPPFPNPKPPLPKGSKKIKRNLRKAHETREKPIAVPVRR